MPAPPHSCRGSRMAVADSGFLARLLDLAEMAQQARQMTDGGHGAQPADFLVGTHLVTRGENWKLQLSLVRSYRWQNPRLSFLRLRRSRLPPHLASGDGGSAGSTSPPKPESRAARHQRKPKSRPAELDHYLFRLEQTLAVRCGTLDGSAHGFLSNPAEILDGVLHLCLQNPAHLPSRILLWRVLDGLKNREPELRR